MRNAYEQVALIIFTGISPVSEEFCLFIATNLAYVRNVHIKPIHGGRQQTSVNCPTMSVIKKFL